MIRALPSLVGRSGGVLATCALVMLALAIGVAVPVFNSRSVLVLDGILVISALGFGIFYAFVRAELTLVRGVAAYLLALASLFATFNNVRVIPVTGGALPSATVSDALLLSSGLVLLMASLVERHQWVLYPRPVIVGVCLLAISVGVTVAVSPASAGARPTTGLLFWAAVALTPLVVGTGASTRRTLLAVMALWLASGAVNGIVAVLDLDNLIQLGGSLQGRAEGLTNHPNNLGISCAMVIPVGVVLFVAVRNTVSRLALAGLTVLAAIAVLLSGSRAATLATVFGLVVIPVLGYRHRLRTILLTLAALVGAAVIYSVSSSFFVSLQRLTGQISVGDSDVDRIEAWRIALGQIAANPLLGTGYASVTTASDLALQILVSGGMLGLIGFSLFIGGMLTLGIRLCRNRALSREFSLISSGLTASVLVFLVFGVVSDEIYDRFLYWPFGLLLAVYVLGRGTAPIPEVPKTSASPSPIAHSMDLRGL